MNNMPSETNNLGLSIIDSVATDNILDVVTEISEIAFDSIFNGSEIFEAVPFLGSALKWVKIGISVRDRLFLKKTVDFC